MVGLDIHPSRTGAAEGGPGWNGNQAPKINEDEDEYDHWQLLQTVYELIFIYIWQETCAGDEDRAGAGGGGGGGVGFRELWGGLVLGLLGGVS